MLPTEQFGTVAAAAALATVMMTSGNAVAGPKVEAIYEHGGPTFTLATGSPGELGLLEALAAGFAERRPATLRWVKAGSGTSLKLLEEKEVDLVMVHAPEAEKQAVSDGWAVGRTLIGSNEFYIVGPADDPARTREAGSAAAAYRRIALAEAPFITRADSSGTHKKEMAIWELVGLKPEGDWYIASHDFMTASLMKANELGGYFMTDSSTWVAEKPNAPNLAVLFQGDPFLVNTYHALLPPDATTPGREVAARFVEFVAGAKGQEIIRTYGANRFGGPLYQDAEYAKQYVH